MLQGSLPGGLDATYGVGLLVDAWHDAHEDGWDWTDMDRYILHQVSDVHTNAIVKAAKNRAGAERFLTFLRGAEARRIFEQFKFRPYTVVH